MTGYFLRGKALRLLSNVTLASRKAFERSNYKLTSLLVWQFAVRPVSIALL